MPIAPINRHRYSPIQVLSKVHSLDRSQLQRL